MRKLIALVFVTTSFTMAAAFAQNPAKPDVSPFTDGAVTVASTPNNSVAKTALTRDAQTGALNECYNTIGDQPWTALHFLQPCLERNSRNVTSEMNIAYKESVAGQRR